MKQITENQKKQLEKQGYRIVGNHSALKTCLWVKNKLTRNQGCYKNKFYGINSHQCLQMTTSMYCANRCKICWRSEKAPISKKWYGIVDEPDFIIDESIKKHIKLLQGFKGNEKADKKLIKEMENVKHAALSLIGEPITYPKINELLEKFHKRKISTFLVTNAQNPEQIKKIKKSTQLYLSLDAPNKKLLKEIDSPLFPDYYERLLKSLKFLSEKKFRTCIRLTIIKGINDIDLKGYKKLIELGNPDFIEVKAFMRLGPSRKIYEWDNMPSHEYIAEFAEKLIKYLPDYEIASEHKPSSVVLLMKKSLKGKRFIDFDKFFKLKNPSAENYSLRTI